MAAVSGVFRKLNLTVQTKIVVTGAPSSFLREVARLRGVHVRKDLEGARGVSFALAFVTKKAEVEKTAKAFARRAEGDALLWIAYPKRSSKRYSCEFDRDTGFSVLGALGFEPVRMVAIDLDWCALRFRRVEFIQELRRNPRRALSQAGRARASRARAGRSS